MVAERYPVDTCYPGEDIGMQQSDAAGAAMRENRADVELKVVMTSGACSGGD
jgi:hypothetical protein